MKLTKSRLKQLIREELENQAEDTDAPKPGSGRYEWFIRVPWQGSGEPDPDDPIGELYQGDSFFVEYDTQEPIDSPNAEHTVYETNNGRGPGWREDKSMEDIFAKGVKKLGVVRGMKSIDLFGMPDSMSKRLTGPSVADPGRSDRDSKRWQAAKKKKEDAERAKAEAEMERERQWKDPSRTKTAGAFKAADIKAAMEKRRQEQEREKAASSKKPAGEKPSPAADKVDAPSEKPGFFGRMRKRFGLEEVKKIIREEIKKEIRKSKLR